MVGSERGIWALRKLVQGKVRDFQDPRAPEEHPRPGFPQLRPDAPRQWAGPSPAGTALVPVPCRMPRL